MSIYSDIKVILNAVGIAEQLSDEVGALTERVRQLELELAELKGRHESIVLLSEKAARRATLDAIKENRENRRDDKSISPE
ncbi:hypothetical protein [Marinovum sp.]|uniref:hypothetical protein n=1 Tax=Marinovum sp. TaxID=2024839 RepID=UPI002B26CB70|nr:hypothetical protein [Marinovum sp.]